MKDAGLLLLPDGVAAPAHERAVLQRPRRREGEDGGGSVGPDEALLNLCPESLQSLPQKLNKFRHISACFGHPLILNMTVIK